MNELIVVSAGGDGCIKVLDKSGSTACLTMFDQEMNIQFVMKQQDEEYKEWMKRKLNHMDRMKMEKKKRIKKIYSDNKNSDNTKWR